MASYTHVPKVNLREPCSTWVRPTRVPCSANARILFCENLGFRSRENLSLMTLWSHSSSYLVHLWPENDAKNISPPKYPWLGFFWLRSSCVRSARASCGRCSQTPISHETNCPWGVSKDVTRINESPSSRRILPATRFQSFAMASYTLFLHPWSSTAQPKVLQTNLQLCWSGGNFESTHRYQQESVCTIIW